MLLEVGKVTRPHGLHGAVVVELVTNRHERVAPGAVLRGPTGPLTVAQASRLSAAGGRERWAVRFTELGDRDAAERLRGAALQAAAIDDPDALWVHQLIGATVFDVAGRALGEVRAVEANPASDLLVLDSGALIPLRFIQEAAPARVTVDLPPGLVDF